MSVVHEITIDLLNPRKSVVHVVQGDNMRSLRLTLLADNVPFDVSQGLASGGTVVGFVHYENSSNHYVGEYSATLNDETAVTLASGTVNVWNVILDSRCFLCSGFAKINILFKRSDDLTIGTFSIMVDVEEIKDVPSSQPDVM